VRVSILVRPKYGIRDPQGDAVRSSLRQLGFDVDAARVGRVVDLDVAGDDEQQTRAEVARMCEQLLANPLIEAYEIERVPEELAGGRGGESPAPVPGGPAA
jgi:phosphoribosylformylglycinamidine synthase subunit PurS